MLQSNPSAHECCSECTHAMHGIALQIDAHSLDCIKVSGAEENTPIRSELLLYKKPCPRIESAIDRIDSINGLRSRMLCLTSHRRTTGLCAQQRGVPHFLVFCIHACIYTHAHFHAHTHTHTHTCIQPLDNVNFS